MRRSIGTKSESDGSSIEPFRDRMKLEVPEALIGVEAGGEREAHLNTEEFVHHRETETGLGTHP